MKKRYAFFSAVLAASLALTACSNSNSTTEKVQGTTEEQREQVLNIAEAADIPSMDSTKADDVVSFNTMNNVMEGLYRLDEDNEPVPGMAKDFSQEGNVITFELREDAKWSNGDAVTANDFVFAWRKALTPDTLSPYAYIMNDVKNSSAIQDENDPLYGKVEELGVTAKDDYTLEVELERAVPYFVSLTSFVTFYPQNEKFVTAQGDQYGLEPDNLLFNGPFVLSEWNHGDGWKMTKNDQYWDKETVNLEQVNVKVIKEVSTEVNLYDTGDLDRAILSSDFVENYAGGEDFFSYGEPTMWYLKMNQKKPELANENIRRAISMAFNKEDLVNVILNNGSVAADYFMPQNFAPGPNGEDFREKNGSLVSYNKEEAKKLWEKGLEEIGKESLELSLLQSDSDTAKSIGEYLKEQMETSLPGLTVVVNQQPFKQRLALEDAFDYQLQLAGWGPDYLDPMTFMDLWVTNGGNNKMGYSNPDYDKLIESAKTELDDLDKRWENLQEAERILLEEDAALAPIYQRGRSVVQQPYVKDLIIHPFGPEYSYKWTYLE